MTKTLAESMNLVEETAHEIGKAEGLQIALDLIRKEESNAAVAQRPMSAGNIYKLIAAEVEKLA